MNLVTIISSKIVSALEKYCPDQNADSVVVQMAQNTGESEEACNHLAISRCICKGGECAICSSNMKDIYEQNGSFDHGLDEETIQKNWEQFSSKYQQLEKERSENPGIKYNRITLELKSMLGKESHHIQTKGRVANIVNAWCQCVQGDGKCPFENQALQPKSCGSQLSAFEYILRALLDKQYTQDETKTKEIHGTPYTPLYNSAFPKLYGAIMIPSIAESGYRYPSFGQGADYSNAYLFEADKAFGKADGEVRDLQGLSAEDIHGINIQEIEKECEEALQGGVLNVYDSFLLTMAFSMRYARDGGYMNEMSMLASVIMQSVHDVEDYKIDVKQKHNTFVRCLVAYYGVDKASEILAQICKDVMNSQLIGGGEDGIYSCIVWSILWGDSKTYSEVAVVLGIPLTDITLFTQAGLADRIRLFSKYYLEYRNILWGTLRKLLQEKGWWYNMITDSNALYSLL